MMILRQFVRRQTFVSLGAVSLIAALAACGESTTEPGGEQEVISRVTLTLTQAGTSTTVTSYIDDPDGNGPQSPSAQVGPLRLVPGATYSGTIKFENRLVSPAEDITKEVQEEANEHRVFYTVTGSGLTVTTTDLDPQGRPLGLKFNTVAGASGTGTLRVVLCHYDDSPKNTSATSCTGDTDIDLSFSYSIGN